MILVTLGTQDKSFVRLLKALDKEINRGIIKDKVIVQAGFTKYESPNMEIFETIPNDELEELIEKADLIITHGGVGSILTALKHNKKVIAAPRLSKYHEHTNDHQKQIVTEFSKRGYILELKDFTKFDKVLEKSGTFKPKKYKSNNEKFQQIITTYLDDVDHISWYNRNKIALLLSFLNFLIFSLLLLFDLNIFIVFFISYFFTIILSFFSKERKSLIHILVFFVIEGLLISLISKFNLNYILFKALINIICLFLYNFFNIKFLK